MTNNELQIKTGVFTTRSAAMMYLVQMGMPVNYVKAAIDQSFNYEPNDDVRDAMWVQDDTPEGVFVPSSVIAADVCQAYNTMVQMFTIKNDIIMLDGEPVYDINGDRLNGCDDVPGWIKDLSPGHAYQLAAMILGVAIKKNYKGIVTENGYKGTLKDFATDELNDNFGEELWGELHLGV